MMTEGCCWAVSRQAYELEGEVNFQATTINKQTDSINKVRK
jgi:hypothetical protein